MRSGVWISVKASLFYWIWLQKQRDLCCLKKTINGHKNEYLRLPRPKITTFIHFKATHLGLKSSIDHCMPSIVNQVCRVGDLLLSIESGLSYLPKLALQVMVVLVSFLVWTFIVHQSAHRVPPKKIQSSFHSGTSNIFSLNIFPIEKPMIHCSCFSLYYVIVMTPPTIFFPYFWNGMLRHSLATLEGE